MPSGGARSRSGPMADPNSLRAAMRADHKSNNLVTLPADGRKGDPPTWPLVVTSGLVFRRSQSGETREYDLALLREREIELWVELWKLPQAIIWERDRLTIPVALFVRQLAEGELPHSSAENRKTIKMYLSDLYMTSDALVKGGYRIGEVEAPKARAFRTTSGKSHLAIVIPPGE